MFCYVCGSKLWQYETSFIDGKVYYCEKNQNDHPWLWFHSDGTVTVKVDIKTLSDVRPLEETTNE